MKTQLIQAETLANAGMRFVPHGFLLETELAKKDVHARDLGDRSDLAALSSHTSCLLHGFLGQAPFGDEEKRSTIIRQVYLDGSRADDDDTVFEEQGPYLALQVDHLRQLCHMCSWQLASLADLCENMSSFAGKKMRTPDKHFTDCMGSLVSDVYDQ